MHIKCCTEKSITLCQKTKIQNHSSRKNKQHKEIVHICLFLIITSRCLSKYYILMDFSPRRKPQKYNYFFTLNPVPCAGTKQGKLHAHKHLPHWVDAIPRSLAQSPPTGKKTVKSWRLDLQVEEQSNPPSLLVLSKDSVEEAQGHKMVSPCTSLALQHHPSVCIELCVRRTLLSTTDIFFSKVFLAL